MLDQITPVLLTYNEAANLPRSLAALRWAKRIVVVDSYSDDETLAILQQYPQVELFQRTFDSHARQWNYGLAQVQTDWALSLDGDYVVTPELQAELQILTPPREQQSYWLRFRYCVFGQPLGGTILPPRQALFRVQAAQYTDDGHTQLLHCPGPSSTLSAPIWHDDRKSLQRWLWAQDRYAKLEVEKLQQTALADLGLGDRIRCQTPLAPLIILLYCLILKGGLFDGARGFYYAGQRCVAELILLLRLLESRSVINSRGGPVKTNIDLAPAQ